MFSVIEPLPASPSSCGYCGQPGERSIAKTNLHVACFIAVRLSCDAYQKMIDRGWRRSGTYCYKPDLKRSCCPQYTIRLDALQFKTSKSQRKLVNRFNRWITHGDDAEINKQKQKSSGKQQEVFSLEEAIHESEHRVCGQQQVAPAHNFEITLELSSYTPEKFELYQRYQRDIHKEIEEKQPDSFDRFLVETPLFKEPIPYSSAEVPSHLPREYGSYHQLYRIDGELVAVGVIDVLPHCVSSVYFMYDKQWERFSLGKLSALREVSLAKEMAMAGAPEMGYLYMGFYIHSCPKMRYKGEYAPSFLADPEEHTWHPLERCTPLLEKNRYACFAHPERSLVGACDAPAVPEVTQAILKKAMYIKEVTRQGEVSIAPLTTWAQYGTKRSAKNTLHALVQALGEDVLEDTFLHMTYVL